MIVMVLQIILIGRLSNTGVYKLFSGRKLEKHRKHHEGNTGINTETNIRESSMLTVNTLKFSPARRLSQPTDKTHRVGNKACTLHSTLYRGFSSVHNIVVNTELGLNPSPVVIIFS